MSDPIISLDEIRQSAHQAFLSGRKITDIPAKFYHHEKEWRDAYERAQFEMACA